jgi:hypothetical protein
MRTLVRTLWVVSLSLLAWGCASAPGADPHTGGHPAGHAAHAEAAPSSPEETVRRCALPDWTARQKCYEARLLAELRASGVPAAMALLDRLATLRPDVKREGHVYAHAIGINAYGSMPEVGKTFATCTPAYQSGCYHG